MGAGSIDYREQLCLFYETRGLQDKIQNIDVLLERYQGREGVLMRKVRSKYANTKTTSQSIRIKLTKRQEMELRRVEQETAKHQEEEAKRQQEEKIKAQMEAFEKAAQLELKEKHEAEAKQPEQEAEWARRAEAEAEAQKPMTPEFQSVSDGFGADSLPTPNIQRVSGDVRVNTGPPTLTPTSIVMPTQQTVYSSQSQSEDRRIRNSAARKMFNLAGKKVTLQNQLNKGTLSHRTMGDIMKNLEDKSFVTFMIQKGTMHKLVRMCTELINHRELFDMLKAADAKRCIRQVINSPEGMEALMKHERIFRELISQCLESSSESLQDQGMEILAAVCATSKRGRHIAIDFMRFLDRDKPMNDGGQRWNTISKWLEPTIRVPTITHTLIVINALLSHNLAHGFHSKR